MKSAIASDSTDREFCCMYKDVKKNRTIRNCMETLSIHTGYPTVHLEDNKIYISIIKSKLVTPRKKHINIPVCFIQEKYDNGLFIPKYDKCIIISDDFCTKPFPGSIIYFSTKWMSGFCFYSSTNYEHYQLMRLQKCEVT